MGQKNVSLFCIKPHFIKNVKSAEQHIILLEVRKLIGIYTKAVIILKAVRNLNFATR